jgi:hypothetical protein
MPKPRKALVLLEDELTELTRKELTRHPAQISKTSK